MVADDLKIAALEAAFDRERAAREDAERAARGLAHAVLALRDEFDAYHDGPEMPPRESSAVEAGLQTAVVVAGLILAVLAEDKA